MYKRLVPPSRSFVEWKFDELDAKQNEMLNSVHEKMDAMQSRINVQQTEINFKIDKEINTERQVLLNLSKALKEGFERQQKIIDEQQLTISKQQKELLEQQKGFLEQQKSFEKKLALIENQNKAIIDQQNQIKRLETLYRRELAGRIYEQIPTYMKGTNYPQREEKIIVSLTSYLPRIQFVAPCIYSLLHQTVKPDMVFLWLSEENFPKREKDLPQELLDLRTLGLTIRWCPEDLKPHKKYYYTMKEYPDDIVITVDDDVLYRPQLIEDLYKAYQKNPKSVYTTRARKMGWDSVGNILPYNDWKLYECGGAEGPDFSLLPTGVGGVLYPPHCLDEEVFNTDEIRKLCLFTDDLWLKLMQLKKEIPVTKINWLDTITYVEGSQENSLYLRNMGQNQNDLCIQKMIDYFGQREGFIENIKFLLGGGKIKPLTVDRKDWIGSAKYWENRYKNGGNSGAGSYNRLREFKANILNLFVCEHDDIRLVVEWGCGDGSQLELADYPEYIGYDVSETAIEICKNKFKEDLTKEFFWCGETNFNSAVKGDLTLSLDVIYHLIEDEIFETYIRRLFETSSKYVCIYSCNFDREHTIHVKCRNFTKYIEKNISGWELIKKINNKYPYDEKNPNNTSWSDFYFYKKINI